MIRCDDVDPTVFQDTASFQQLLLTAPEHAAFTSRTGEETTDCRSGKRQSRGARLTHRWRRRPTSSEICPGPFPQGLESSPILFKLTAVSIPTPNPGMSKVPQKDSQKSKGAHPGPSLMQGCKLHPAVSPLETDAHR